MTTADEALIEQIRRARSIPADWARLREGESAMEQIERMRKRQDDQTIALIRKAQADAWDEAIRYSIECANETTDSWGNMYRLDWIARMEHEIEENPYRTKEARS